MESKTDKRQEKTHIDSLVARSIRDLIDKVNSYNEQHPNTPILKEDIVDILRGEECFTILYYK